MEDEASLAICVPNSDRDMKNGMQKTFRERYREIARIGKDAGRPTFLTTWTTIPGAEENETETINKKIIYKIPIESRDDKPETEWHWYVYRQLKQFADWANIHETETIRIPKIDGMSTEQMRKITEYAFRNCCTKMIIHIPEVRKKQLNLKVPSYVSTPNIAVTPSG